MALHENPYPGIFIAIEGPDYAGKSTATETLKQELRKRMGVVAKTTRMIGGNPYCENVRSKLLTGVFKTEDEKLEAVADAFANNYKNIVKPVRRNRGDIIISDRWFYSTLVYQGLHSNGFMRYADQKLFAKAKARLEKQFLYDFKRGVPDILIVLNPGPETTLERSKVVGKKDSMDSQTLLEHHRMASAYEFVSKGDNLGGLEPGLTIVAKDIKSAINCEEFADRLNRDYLYRRFV